MHRRSALSKVFIIFFVTWSVAMRQTVVGQGGDCSPLVGSDLGDFDSLNQTGLISMALLSQPAVQLLDYNIVCIAQGTMKDTWRMVSGVASYMLAGGMDTVQFHFQCESDGSAWNTTIINSTDFVLTSPPNATFDTMNRTDCALCVSPEQLPGGGADNDQHCVSCASECNVTGLMRCISQESTDCCTYFGPAGQCINGSSCPGNSVPSDTFECICPPNYTGAECTMDVNECETDTNPCRNGANCTNTEGNFTCDCPPGFTGSVCDITIDACVGEPCMNGGTCMDNNDGNFTCSCPFEFTGSLCDVSVVMAGECELNLCMNGGTCMNNSGSIVCLCSSGYNGSICDMDIDDCSPNPCLNGAECIDGLNEFTCNCTADWNGTLCDLCTLENCANCTADENQSFAAVCVQCEDGYQLENETCRPVCQVDGCVNCSQSSSTVCEECESGLTRAQDGSSCSAMMTTPTPPGPSMTTNTATSTGNNTGRLAGIVVGSVVGGLLLILLVAVIIGAIVYWHRKKSRVTLTFDLNTMKATHITANPVFEDIGREDSGIENDDEITVNKGALEFEGD